MFSQGTSVDVLGKKKNWEKMKISREKFYPTVESHSHGMLGKKRA